MVNDVSGIVLRVRFKVPGVKWHRMKTILAPPALSSVLIDCQSFLSPNILHLTELHRSLD